MASKKTCISKTGNSIYNYLKKDVQTSKDESSTSSKTANATKKRPIFSLKKPSNSATWTPPFKTTQENHNRIGSSIIEEQKSLDTTSNGVSHKFDKIKSTKDDSHFASDIMDVDDSAFGERCKTPTSEGNKSLRISATPTPPKNRANNNTNKNRLIHTPEKKSPANDRDPLKKLKIDSSISGFLTDISEHPALNKYGKNKADTLTLEEIDECKTMYIELLEKISDAFSRIPNCIKEKFPGYDSKTYSKMNHLKTKLKLVIQKKPKENIISQNTESSLSSLSNEPNGYDEMNGNKSPSLLSGQFNYPRNSDQIKSASNFQLGSIDTSTPDVFAVTNSKSDKTVYSDMASKKSLLFEALSPCANKISSPDTEIKPVDVTPDSSKVKGKFTFKRPSAARADDLNKSSSNPVTPTSTFERLKLVTEKLKPLPLAETSKSSPLANSSVAFQPPESSKKFLQNLNSIASSPTINQSPGIDLGDETDYDMPFEDDDVADVFPETSKDSVVNISDSSNVQMGNKEIPVDEDGFPIYRAEDFEDDINLSSVEDPEVYNIMDQTTQSEGAPKYEGMGDFHAGTKNDGITGEFDGLEFPHSLVMMEMLKEKFGLKSFRPNQLQVINATLLHHDCFVLMPTGGGKSLCYQLPAILTPGVTIVISPLKSLILDQVHKLLSLDIPAAHLSGELSLADTDEIYHKLSMQEPMLKLLYVTPEKVSNSDKLRNMLAALYQREKLARFVVDEAHCVSAWGHDFRRDYKQLCRLRVLYPRVPLLALTATAAPRVRLDILHQLQMKEADCKWFLSSFNRANLVYRVLEKKPKSVNEEIAKMIKSKFFSDSGIVYCFSRKECETLATDLRKVGIQAAPYHAGLADKKRETLQAGWVADKYKVICATVAFGMGVDKADVRYVIHHSMPRSLEGYYQETGRAGRDGVTATCLLYYSYRDVWRYRRLLDGDRDTPAEVRRVNTENLLRMVELCESVTECRRVQVLAYLGERFSAENCKRNKETACDNCLNEQSYKSVDVTADCKEIVRGVRSAPGAATLLQLADALRGSTQQRLGALRDSALHARCKSWPRGDAQRLLRQLVVRGVLAERLVFNNDIPSAYLTLGPHVDKLMSGGVRVVFPMRCERKASLLPAPAAPREDSTIHARIKHIEDRCYADIVEACREMGRSRGVSLSAVLPQAAQRAMAARLPETAADMLALPHVTRANYDKYGHRLLAITAAYAIEKMGVLMEYQDELEQDMNKEQEAEDADTDWGGLAREAEVAGGSSRGGGRGRGRGRKTYRGGVRKRYKRKDGASSAKKKAYRGAMRGGRGGFSSAKKSVPSTSSKMLGSMPLPRPKTRPGVFQPSNLKF